MNRSRRHFTLSGLSLILSTLVVNKTSIAQADDLPAFVPKFIADARQAFKDVKDYMVMFRIMYEDYSSNKDWPPLKGEIHNFQDKREMLRVRWQSTQLTPLIGENFKAALKTLLDEAYKYDGVLKKNYESLSWLIDNKHLAIPNDQIMLPMP